MAGVSEMSSRSLEEVIKEKDEIIARLKADLNARLSNEEINRYSRQIILPNVGVEGQLALKEASVLIVGAGGLGCPSALYLAGSGIGHIGIVDYDIVEINNIHRQILHTEASNGLTKVLSAENSLKKINSNLKVTPFHVQLDSTNAMTIISNFDIVIDATDNVATRYLLNDACVLSSKPLVSGSALQMEGQLTIYNHEGGPCYRCVFPTPPPPEAVTNCGTGGVLGVIPGVIGVLQALETIKLILKQSTISGNLLLFDGESTSFKKVKLRQKQPNCVVCGLKPTLTKLIDYEQFCGSKANDKNPDLKLLPTSKRISVQEFTKKISEPHVLIDVRSPSEFKICKLNGSVNIPITKINTEEAKSIILEEVQKESQMKSEVPVYVLCRRGNDSQKAVLALEKTLDKTLEIKDIIGGLHAWAKEIDDTFPVY